ncbi:hypothetical protein E1B28_008412 [Marasmius oreades]|uniref:Glycoside hydrolase family 76 protein n=1 Tax=Marasmius oreades TaxID=181124 RepID=A0A9P7RZJ6_9AGAR|nr:uncharacterized protein E1B28_008412 [Marasmius oreades]KAG7092031.1 hypothetical protein E1B28_008412 [Marasmius oreades]
MTTVDTSNWRKPVITSSVQDRIQIALTALEQSVQTLSSDGQFVSKYYQSGLLYSQMAEFDRISNQTLYKDKLLSFFQSRENEREGSLKPLNIPVAAQFLRDGLQVTFAFYSITHPDPPSSTYGYAAARSYSVYNEIAFLNFAINWWKWASSSTITDSEVISGAVAGKNFTLQTHCMNNPVTGGTFDTLDPTNAVVSLLSSDYYFMYEATPSNKTYLEFATQSFNFIRSQLFTSSEYLPQNSISLDSQDSTKCTTAASGDSVNVGAWIEGLTVINRIADDASHEQLWVNDFITTRNALTHTAVPSRVFSVQGSVMSAITKSDWHTSDQILLSPGTLMGNINLPRGLAAIYQNTKSLELRADIEKYLAVQYNAILDLSTVNGSNTYSYNWTGPPMTDPAFDFDAQVTAQGVLIAAITLSGPGSGNPNTSTSSSSSHSSSVKAIVGGVVGGVAGLVVALGLFLYLRHRRTKEMSKRGGPMDISPYGINEIRGDTIVGTSSAIREKGQPLRQVSGDHQPVAEGPSLSRSEGDRDHQLPVAEGPSLPRSEGDQDNEQPPRINDVIQRLQTDMHRVLQVLHRRPDGDSESVGTQDMPPEYPGR